MPGDESVVRGETSCHFIEKESILRAKSVIYGILGIILGIFFFFGGVSTLSNPNTVTCGGETMSSGDTCVHYTNGSQTGVSDYSQEQQSNHTTGILLLLFGPLTLIGSIFLLRSGLRRRPVNYPSRNTIYSQGNRQPQPGAYPPPSTPPQQPGGPPPPYPYR